MSFPWKWIEGVTSAAFLIVYAKSISIFDLVSVYFS